ncbi:MAG: phosphatase PAP2 family protein [Acidobacteriota bacterium]
MAVLINLGHWLDSRDQRLMRRLNRWRAPKWLRLWMVAATRGGDGWLWLAMSLVVALFGGTHRIAALSAAGCSVGIGIGLFMKLKRMIGRKRPYSIQAPRWAKLLPPDQFSFPSGHTITAFAMAVTLGAFYPEMRPGLYFCATSIAVSRILLGMHFLTDVLAGAALGSLLGIAAAVTFR